MNARSATVATSIAIRHVSFEDLGILRPILAARGFETSYLDAGVDDVSAETLLNADLVVVLGGPIGVYDTHRYPFLPAEIDAIAARLARGLPTLGVCLGAQLMAHALRADVTATGKVEIGYGPLSLTAAGRNSVLAPVDGVPVLHWHGDEFEVPTEGVRLAETPGFPNQAFAVGDTALALQFHLEADHRQIERWLIGHAHELAAAGLDPGRIRSDAGRYGPTLAEAAGRVFGSWLDALGHRPRR